MAKKKKKRHIWIVIFILLAAIIGTYAYLNRDHLHIPDAVYSLVSHSENEFDTLDSPDEVIHCYEKAIHEKNPALMIKIYPKAFRDAYQNSAVLQTKLLSAMDLGIDGAAILNMKIKSERKMTDTEFSAMKEFAKSLSSDTHAKTLGIDTSTLSDFDSGYILIYESDNEEQEIAIVHEESGWCISPKNAVGK